MNMSIFFEHWLIGFFIWTLMTLIKRFFIWTRMPRIKRFFYLNTDDTDQTDLNGFFYLNTDDTDQTDLNGFLFIWTRMTRLERIKRI